MQVISSEETKTRNHLMDNIKGILMISVITAHYLRVGGSFQLSSFDGTVYHSVLFHNAGLFILFRIFFQKSAEMQRRSCEKFSFTVYNYDAIDVYKQVYTFRQCGA